MLLKLMVKLNNRIKERLSIEGNIGTFNYNGRFAWVMGSGNLCQLKVYVMCLDGLYLVECSLWIGPDHNWSKTKKDGRRLNA